ncbi:MAG: FAD-dependent oxidoreductase [Actinomycetota bacterium]
MHRDKPDRHPAGDGGHDVDVAIIGAGIGGLATASALIAAGHDVSVFESRDRVGGRLLSHHAAPRPLDLGATWFWPGERRVAALVEKLNAPTHLHHLAGDAVYHAPEGARRLDGNPIDVPSGRFSAGAESLAAELAAGLPGGAVRLACAVHAIDHHGTRPVVDHEGGTTAARHVVLALAPALAVHRIEFQPGLPERLASLAAATPVWMGAMAKVVVRYDRPFWRDAGLAGAAISHLGPMREIHDMSGPDGAPAALFGFVPLVGTTEVPAEAEITAQLADLFGPGAASPLDIVVKDWRSDPDTSPPGVDALQEYRTYGHPLFQEAALDGRLHWASTETATTAPGHIEGALAAAERAASAIHHDLTTARQGATP